MEPRSTVVDPTGEQITMWSATQVPHILRVMLALVTGVPESKIRVIAPDVGGGFGGKLQFTPEELVTFLVARRLGKPVKYTETRSESIMSGHHGRDQIQRLTLAARKDGTVTGLKVELLADMGAYLGLVTPGVPILGAFMYNAIYKFPAYRFACTNVFTNKTWTDAYRGAGRPEATFAIERMMDELAVELGRDPLEIREQNWIKHEEFPFTTVARARLRLRQLRGGHRPGQGAVRLRRAARASRPSGATRKRPGAARHRHLDVHRDVRPGPVAGARLAGLRRRRLGDAPRSGCCRPARSRSSPARARTARATRRPGARSSPTGWACRSRTSRCCTATPRSRTRAWTPTARARSSVGGIAVVKAADKVIEKAKPIAAHMLEANADDLEFERRPVHASAAPTRASAMADVAFAVFAAHNLPDGVEPTLDADATFDPENFSFPHGTHLCATEVDTETGGVTHPQLRLRRRHRRGRQPADRRGPGARRPRPGHRAGAVRGGRPRRRRAR